jgi:hypothetical protein|nr:MAG TPA: hypothetical protein [Caudoviricetes sp.]
MAEAEIKVQEHEIDFNMGGFEYKKVVSINLTKEQRDVIARKYQQPFALFNVIGNNDKSFDISGIAVVDTNENESKSKYIGIGSDVVIGGQDSFVNSIHKFIEYTLKRYNKI